MKANPREDMQQNKEQEVEVEPPALTTSDTSSPKNEKLIATETNDRGPTRCRYCPTNGQ